MSKELREKYKRRSLPVRKGDEVEIMRGEHAGKKGKIARLDLKKYRVYIEGIIIKRTAGTEVQVPIHPSNLKLVNPDLTDKFRRKILERKKEVKLEAQKTAGAKVLEGTKESNKVGSKP